jgi:hypothetical protein
MAYIGSNDPLFKVKLLAALRSGLFCSFSGDWLLTKGSFPGDPAMIIPLISELNRGSRTSLDGSVNEAAAAALHLAIRCASCKRDRLYTHKGLTWVE